jgi:hypothetical protein
MGLRRTIVLMQCNSHDEPARSEIHSECAERNNGRSIRRSTTLSVVQVRDLLIVPGVTSQIVSEL